MKNMVMEFKKLMESVQEYPVCDEEDVMLSFIRENTSLMTEEERDYISDLYFSRICYLKFGI